MRYTEKQNGKNVIRFTPGKEFPYWAICTSDNMEVRLRGDAVDKLAAYEDIGLTPEEIEDRQDVCLWIPEDRFTEIVNAEANGRLVVLPCKVGDTVYALERWCDGSIGDCDSRVSCEECDDYKQQINPRRIVSIDAAFAVIEMLGKTVFLTRAEAEAALKGETE